EPSPVRVCNWIRHFTVHDKPVPILVELPGGCTPRPVCASVRVYKRAFIIVPSFKSYGRVVAVVYADNLKMELWLSAVSANSAAEPRKFDLRPVLGDIPVIQVQICMKADK